MRILVVEDDRKLARQLKKGLDESGHLASLAFDGREGLESAQISEFDVLVLDVMLPGLDGISIVRQLRHRRIGTPILLLTARDTPDDIITGLDAGADDYLTKPFGVNELLARIRVALRHAVAAASSTDAPGLEIGPLRLDFARREVRVAGVEVRLTPIEYRLLALLAQNAGKVLTHRQILKEVWGPGAVAETHYLRVFMAQLRRKIEPDPARPRLLLTEPGVGYRMRES